MAKQIIFTYDDKDYVLEYTRDSVKRMEAHGLVLEDVSKKPMTMLPMLFEGAFYAHHAKAIGKLTDEIYKAMPDKQKLIAALSDMITETLETLTAEPDADTKNIEWELSE